MAKKVAETKAIKRATRRVTEATPVMLVETDTHLLQDIVFECNQKNTIQILMPNFRVIDRVQVTLAPDHIKRYTLTRGDNTQLVSMTGETLKTHSSFTWEKPLCELPIPGWNGIETAVDGSTWMTLELQGPHPVYFHALLYSRVRLSPAVPELKPKRVRKR